MVENEYVQYVAKGNGVYMCGSCDNIYGVIFFIVIIEYYDKATKVYWSTIEHKLLLNSNYLPLIIRFSLIFRIRTGLGPLRHPSQ